MGNPSVTEYNSSCSDHNLYFLSSCLAILLTLFSPGLSFAQQQPLPQHTGPYYTACARYGNVPGQPQPLGLTADGYPAFNMSYCTVGRDTPVGSLDGMDTFDASTGTGYYTDSNGVTQTKQFLTPSQLQAANFPVWGAGPSSTTPGTPYQSWWSGYMCDELAHRYFHFKWHVDINYPSIPDDLCQEYINSNKATTSKYWSPANGAVYVDPVKQGPKVGDVVVYSNSFPGVSILDQTRCNENSSWVPSSHIAVVRAVYGKPSDPGGLTFDAVNENWDDCGGAPCSSSGIATGINSACACVFVHATGNGGETCSNAAGSTGTVSGGNLLSACADNSSMIETASIDGIPAFYNKNTCPALLDHSCCSDNTELNLFSDNKGLSYATMPPIGGFATEYGWGYQCEEFAYRYVYGRFGIKLPPVPSAWQMCGLDSSEITTYWASGNGTPDYSSYTPVHGDVMVFFAGPNACQVGGSNGHVAIVADKPSAAPNDPSKIWVVEQNWGNGGNEPRSADKSCARCYMHINKNPVSGSSAAACRTEPYALATYMTGPAVVLDGPSGQSQNSQSGALVVFVSKDGQLYYKAQKGQSGGANHDDWDDTPKNTNGWTVIDGANNLLGDPVVVAHGLINASQAPLGISSSQAIDAGEIEVFYVANDNTIWHVWQTKNTSVRGGTWSKPAQIGGANAVAASQITAYKNIAAFQNVLFYVNDKQQIQSIYTPLFNNYSYDPAQTGNSYTWHTPVTISTKGVAGSGCSGNGCGSSGAVSNIIVTAGEGVNASNSSPDLYLFYAGTDKSVQMIKAVGAMGNNFIDPAAINWPIPQPITSDAAVQQDTVTSNLSATGGGGGPVNVYFRGKNYGIVGVPPSPGSVATGCSSANNCGGWTGALGPPININGQSTSDIAVREMLGYTELFYRSGEGGLEYIKQIIDTSQPPNILGWGGHNTLVGTQMAQTCSPYVQHCPCVSSPGSPATSACPKDMTQYCYWGPENTTALPYINNGYTIFSVPALGLNYDWRSEIFYFGGDGAVWHIWETAAPTYTNPYPAWSCVDSLGGPQLPPPPPAPQNQPGPANPCSGLQLNASCGLSASGSGLYCGGNAVCGMAGDKNTLYTCQQVGNQFITTSQQYCGAPPHTCIVAPLANQADYCQ